MTMGRFARGALTIALLASSTLFAAVAVAQPEDGVDNNQRLNNAVLANVYTMQKQAGCPTEVKGNRQLVEAARRQALDAVNNPDLNGDLGSDGSTPQTRANDAGFVGTVAQTVATNPALAINAIDILGQWYWDPVAKAIIENCANTVIGVSTANSLSRTVTVAVYGQPA
jgi:uncharacterized protein YkwD